MDQATASRIFDKFLAATEVSIGMPLAALDQHAEKIAGGWVFYYQSREYVETGEFSAMLVGQGPVIVLDDGRILEGGSIDARPEDVLKRHGIGLENL